MTTYFVSNAGSNTAPYDTEAKAATTLGVIAALPWAATDIVKVSSTHTETAGAAISYTLPTTPGMILVSVLFDGSGTGAVTAGASIAVGASNNVFIITSGFAYIFGLTLAAGTGNSAAGDFNIATGAVASGVVMDTCEINIPSTNTGAVLSIGPSASGSTDDIQITLNNCTHTKGNNSTIRLQNGRIRINNLTIAAGTFTSLFQFTTGANPDCIITASDFSAATVTNLVNLSGTTMFGRFIIAQTKLPSAAITTGTFAGPGSVVIEIIDSSNADVQYDYEMHCWQGVVEIDSGVYADATDGTQGISWLMTGNANTSFTYPLATPPMEFFNSSLTAMTTIVPVMNDGTTFTDAQLWQETLAKVTSTSTKGTWNIADRVASILATPANQASSTQSWTGTPGGAVKQQLESGSFTPAEVGGITVVVYLAANDSVNVSPKVLTGSTKQWMTLAGLYVNESAPAASLAARVIGGYHG